MKKQFADFVSPARRLLAVALCCGVATISAAAADPSYPNRDADAPRSGSAASSATASSSASKSATLDDQNREFIHHAAKSGLMEIQLSQLALERTSDAKVRVCAQAIVNDHQRAHAELAQIANRNGIMLPVDTASASLRMGGSEPGESTRAGRSTTSASSGTSSATSDAASTTTSAHTEEVRKISEEVERAVSRLSRESTENFDRAYLDEMVKGHEKAIELFEAQAKRTDHPELAQYAQSKLPTLREHLSRSQALQRSLKG